MPVELRKRKAPAEPAPAPPSKKSNPIKKAVEKAKGAITGKKSSPANGTQSAGPPTVGSVISLDGFGGEIETNDGQKTTLKKLVEASTSGVVLFTYPKASTPGCTKQACLFRDDYTPLTATGLAIYGLSRDSPKANTTFKEKQKLPYSLLCDPSASLIGAIGLKKAPSGTTRGVFAVDKSGKVLVSEPGGPDATVAAIKKIVVSEGINSADEHHEADPPASESTKMDVDASKEPEKPAGETTEANGAPLTKEDTEKANVAAEVADTAAKIDPATPVPA